MRACIHRGTKEIGGTCVEIESQGQRIVLDVGVPLDVADPDTFPLHPVPGFNEADPSLLAVVISHPHQDHYGLAYRLPDTTRFLIGQAAGAILAAAVPFSPAGVRLEHVQHLIDRQPIILGPFTITPFLVDHSAYDAYAILIEADGAALFYSGDLRAHGRKGKLFHKLLRLPPQHVDLVLMEGTTISRTGSDAKAPTEAQLEALMATLFNQTSGMPLVCCSGQNIDRLVTVFRACLRTDRQFIIDLYTASVLKATGNEHIPQAGWDRIKVFVPQSQRIAAKRNQDFDFVNAIKPWRIFPERLAEAAPHSVMLFRPSMTRDLEKAGCLDGAHLIYSMWRGYLEGERMRWFHAWLNQHGIPLDHCHTSGHAAVEDLVKLRQTFPTAPVVPIHTQQPEAFEQLFGNVQMHADGEWWRVTHTHERQTP